MIRMTFSVVFVLLFAGLNAQLVEVEYNYNGVGDCVFGAVNYLKTPVFLNIDFADLQNTTFNETLPYVKKLAPGYNNLFILTREGDDVPRFNYNVKSYRSNPMAQVNLDFPYLIPFAPGEKITPFDVKSIGGFWGQNEPDSWVATGFLAHPGQKIYASRQGEIVEIVGSKRNEDTKTWYNTWLNTITLLQTDGTLFCYKNVVDPEKKLQLNQKIHAGEILGEVAPNSKELILLIFQNTLSSDDLVFIIPQFQTAADKIEMLNSTMNIEVVHPAEVRGLEMTKRERKKILNLKN